MSLNESIVEDAALGWFGEQCRVAPTLIPAFSHGEKGKERETIRRLNPANACGIPHPASPTGRGEEASARALRADRRATIKRYLQVQTEKRMNP
jgi:hypothetical protein